MHTPHAMHMPRSDLQLEFSAVAATYLWVFTINGAQLHAAIGKFPESAERLYRVARRWAMRRAVVRFAEQVWNLLPFTPVGHSSRSHL